MVAKTIESIDFSSLCTRASVVRKKRDQKDVPCKIDVTRYQSGWFNVVFELEFQDHVFWIVRIQVPTTEGYSPAAVASLQAVMKSEVDTMRYVKLHSTIPVPEVYDFNVNNLLDPSALGYGYILMEALEGRVLPGRFRDVVPVEHQEKVLSTFSNYLVQMSNLRFQLIGRLEATETANGTSDYSIKQCLHPAGCQWPRNSGPFETAIDYFFTTRTFDYRETLKQLPHDSDECFAAWLRLQAAVAIPQLGFNRGPFPLHHPDLRLANILFDDNFNITGVIDWSYTMTVPVEAFANLQSDFGADDCRDSLIQHFRRHESRIDPTTPIANYLSSQIPASKAIVPLQALTAQRLDRMVIAKVLLGHLFGKDAKWGMMKRRWNKSMLYPTPEQAKVVRVWFMGAFMVLIVVCGASVFISTSDVERAIGACFKVCAKAAR